MPMDSVPLSRRLAWAGVYVGLCLVFVFFRLLPLNTVPGGLPGPDLILCLTLAWVIRRPDVLPMPLVAGVSVLADLLLMRPPGLWAALTVAATETLRQGAARQRQPNPLREAAVIAAMVSAMVVGHWLVLTLLFVDQPAIWTQVGQLPWTLAAYPVVAFCVQAVLGLRRAGAPDTGRRLRA